MPATVPRGAETTTTAVAVTGPGVGADPRSRNLSRPPEPSRASSDPQAADRTMPAWPGSLQRDRSSQGLQNLLNHAVVDDVLGDLSEPVDGVDVGRLGIEAAVLPGGDVDA